MHVFALPQCMGAGTTGVDGALAVETVELDTKVVKSIVKFEVLLTIT